ncbi:MAG: hypothetical protein JXQ66_00605 [Campylobacterales bacterium]|nr:hypothetical protein [Campylobacterales bacterium]
MFKKILGKNDKSKNKEHDELVQKIEKMDLTEKKSYINNKISALPVSREGVIEVLKSLIKEDPKTKQRYIKMDDNDTKKKKGFDLVIAISTHKFVTLPVVDLIQEFEEVYRDIIEKYDTDNKQTYSDKIKKAIKNSIITIETIASIHNTSHILTQRY